MSYILDALRKSEQQRQATQPDNVTDRILVNQPPPKPKRWLWLTALLISNLLVIGGLIWYFSKQSAQETNNKQAVNNNSTTTVMVKQQPPEKDAIPNNNRLLPTQQSAPSPSIAQLIENQKASETPKPTKKIPEKKPQSGKKEIIAKSPSAPRNTTEIIEDEPIHKAPPKPTTQTKSLGTPDLNELPYEVRNNLPNLNVNVFSYAQQPEDRFVIIDMVKYKTGQLVKGQIKLKEIRPDSIVLENTDGSKFKVERP